MTRSLLPAANDGPRLLGTETVSAGLRTVADLPYEYEFDRLAIDLSSKPVFITVCQWNDHPGIKEHI